MLASPGWGDSTRHMGLGGGARQPAWRWPCYWSMAHTTTTPMHLNLTYDDPGTINPSAPGLLMLSPPWLGSMNAPLLCACDIASFFSREAMPHSSLPPLLCSPATGYISSSSSSTWALPLCLPSPPGPSECHDKEASQG